MLSHRWTKALAVGALVLTTLTLFLFVTSFFLSDSRTLMSKMYPCQSHDEDCGMGSRAMSVQNTLVPMMMDESGSMGVADKKMMYSAPVLGTEPLPPMMGQRNVVSAERTIAREASLDLRVKSLKWTLEQIRSIVKNTGGFVANSNMSEPERGMRSAWLSVMVPADRLEVALTEMRQAADQVLNESMGATDMTAQRIDLEARLKNKRDEEKAYVGLLASAAKVSDVMEITRSLTAVRTEIESLEQQARFLAGQTELSTINITLTEDPAVQAHPGEFQRGNLLKAALNTLIDALIALGSGLVVFLISGLPILLIMLGLIFLVYRLARRIVNGIFS